MANKLIHAKQSEEELEEIKRKKLEELEEIDYDSNYRITWKEKEILLCIKKIPGLCHNEIAVTLHMSPPALTNKIKILKEHYLIQCIKIGRNVYIYINKRLEDKDCNFFEGETKHVGVLQNESQLTDNIYFEKLLLLSIKNILTLSKSYHSKVLLNNLEFFQYCFSTYEQLHLLYLLEICKATIDFPLKDLFTDNYELGVGNEQELMLRYNEMCFYLRQRPIDERSKTKVKN